MSNKWDPYQGLVAGQTCVVRYRLQGACSYYGPGHTVLKDEREPAPGTPELLGDVQRYEHCRDTDTELELDDLQMFKRLKN